jgi:hypothetical protein
MKAMTARQQSVRQRDTPEGSGEWPGDDGPVAWAGTSFSTTCSSNCLSPAQVHQLLVSPQEGRHVRDLGNLALASGFLGDTEYVPVTLDRDADVCDASLPTEPGDLDDHDVLRASRGVIWVTMFSVPLWISIMLFLYWL